MAINKTEFINRMSEKGGIQKVEARRRVDLFLETLIDCLKEDGTIKLHGFGRFEIRTAKERIGRNPKNGKECMIPEHKKVKFYSSETLTNMVENEQGRV